MKYDRDIRYVRWGMHAMAVANLGTLGLNLYARNLYIAIACGVWLLNVLVWLSVTKVQQDIRDKVRVLQAGLDAIRHDIETGQF